MSDDNDPVASPVRGDHELYAESSRLLDLLRMFQVEIAGVTRRCVDLGMPQQIDACTDLLRRLRAAAGKALGE